MQYFNFEKLNLEGAYIIDPFLFTDERGYFEKKFEKNIYVQNKLEFNVSEIFTSKSVKGTLRGMHFQENKPQAKLVSADYGKIYDVIVDIRKGSTTYGKWEALELSDENKKILYVPKGFAHGFLALSDFAIVTYICDGDYIKEYDTGIIWNDKDIDIDWKLDLIGGEQNLIISDKDRRLKELKDIY